MLKDSVMHGIKHKHLYFYFIVLVSIANKLNRTKHLALRFSAEIKERFSAQRRNKRERESIFCPYQRYKYIMF